MKYEYWFANIKGIGDKRKYEIRRGISSAKELYNIEEKGLHKLKLQEKELNCILESRRTWDVEKEYFQLEIKQVHFLTRMCKDYPQKLNEIASPPYALYVKGQLPREDVLSVAIVGARECSPYGERMARQFAEALASEGVQIISGMARGVDGISQKGALEAGGKTFAILGSGVDVCYPKEHIRIYMEMQENGGLISERPLGTQPLAQFFPARNRIISGLADVLLVIEAKERSGSLITADMALEQGKDVYALPGPTSSQLSRGCHELIKQGAGILLSPKDLLEDLGILYKNKIGNLTENKNSLESRENIVYSCLDFEPKNLGQLSMMTNLTIPVLLNILIGLELKGYIQEVSKNYYVKVK